MGSRSNCCESEAAVAVEVSSLEQYFERCKRKLELCPWRDKLEAWAQQPDLKEKNMLWTIFVILGILWLLGFSLHIGGGLIHLLLVVALIVLVINLLSGRRNAV